MMGRLAFTNEGRYPDFSKGYTLYNDRTRIRIPVGFKTYCNVVRDYCAYLARKLERDGMVDFPHGAGTLFVSLFRRKPQYRGDKFVGYGKMDWKNGRYDGSSSAFGVAFLPSRERTGNMRCFGFVANRRLFKRLKEKYTNQNCDWKPMDFNDNMI